MYASNLYFSMCGQEHFYDCSCAANSRTVVNEMNVNQYRLLTSFSFVGEVCVISALK